MFDATFYVLFITKPYSKLEKITLKLVPQNWPNGKFRLLFAGLAEITRISPYRLTLKGLYSSSIQKECRFLYTRLNSKKEVKSVPYFSRRAKLGVCSWVFGWKCERIQLKSTSAPTGFRSRVCCFETQPPPFVTRIIITYLNVVRKEFFYGER